MISYSPVWFCTHYVAKDDTDLPEPLASTWGKCWDWLYAVLGIKPWTLYMIVKHSTN